MLWYKAWRESRVRFLIAAAAITFLCLMYTLFQAKLYPGAVRETPRIHNYVQYIHWTVFGGVVRAMLQLSCLLLGLGGLQRDRSQGTLGFTLALPVSRVGLVASRAGLAAMQIVALSLIPSLILPYASRLVGQQLPDGYALHFIPLWITGGLFTFAFSFLASVLIANEYASLAVSYVVYMFYLAAARHPVLSRFHIHAADFMSGYHPHYLDRSTMLWAGTYPVAPIAGFFAAALLLLCVGGAVTARQDL